MDKLSLITRNVEEIVKLDELKELIGSKKRLTAYVGYEPSGKIHMGHVLTVNKLLDLQKVGFEIIVLLADLHAYLNEKGELEEIHEMAKENKEAFNAMGLDPNKTTFVLGGSDEYNLSNKDGFQMTPEYQMLSHRLMSHITEKRAIRSMKMIARDPKNMKTSNVVYPVLQVADIVELDIDVAVGGMDQRKIHMLARDVMPKLGLRAPICIHIPILVGLDGTKMSSSKENYISVDDSCEQVKQKIIDAFCPKQVKDNPIVQLFRYHIFPRFSEVTIKRPDKFGGDLHYASYDSLERDFVSDILHPLDLKNAAIEYINEILDPVREVLI
ncbi:MAG: tyrosine--tRNA ligase [Methanocellales archaeon]|nr:tyrosine--tRNA ligase [Methanocellales archaeon]MDD3421527.1 tyrosine--tRNA ligase [Methanocellales archaeon]MDD4897899.1 tyrosine--tRNA ligase [Methanocellales archaeon]MDD5446464.1 tyrosine--tRNA ligase [Methanocellales archaeon]